MENLFRELALSFKDVFCTVQARHYSDAIEAHDGVATVQPTKKKPGKRNGARKVYFLAKNNIYQLAKF